MPDWLYKLLKWVFGLWIYFNLWPHADGTHEYGQAIRWVYLFGELGLEPAAEKRLNRLDHRNFRKWQKLNDNKSFQEYLEVARV